MIIDGKKIAQRVYTELQQLPTPPKELVAVLVGERRDAVSFVRQKQNVAGKLGIRFRTQVFEDTAAEPEIISVLDALSNDDDVGGIILQLPLPEHCDQEKVIRHLHCQKDVDQLNIVQKCVDIQPPTVGALLRILENLSFNLAGKGVVVVGRGRLVGQPVSVFLAGKTARLDSFDTEHFDPQRMREADLVVTGVGQCGVVTYDMVKPGAVVVDFGYSYQKGAWCGDFLPSPSSQTQKFIYTPTPGGTGPVVVAQLYWNFYQLFR